MSDSIIIIIIGYKVDPFPYEVNFIDLPPADPICFKMAQLAEPTLTYDEFVRRWQAKTRELRSFTLMSKQIT